MLAAESSSPTGKLAATGHTRTRQRTPITTPNQLYPALVGFGVALVSQAAHTDVHPGATAGLYFNGTAIYVLGSDFQDSMPFDVIVDDEHFGPIRGNNTANDLNLVPIFGLPNLAPDVQHLIIVQTNNGSSKGNSSAMSNGSSGGSSSSIFQFDGFM